MSEAELPDGWRLASLAELGEVNRGRSRHRPRYAEHLYGGPYPFIQTGDIRTSGGRITSHSTTYSEAGLAQSRLWPAGTMCITIAANIAETAILTYPACFPDSVVGFIADAARADVRFVEYAFRLLKRRLQQEAMGSVQDNINLEVLSRLRLPIPDLDEQAAIASVLGSLDDKIEQNRRTGAKLEGLARAVFKAWFVEFEPVKAKAAGATHFPGMPAATFATLPTRLTDSPLGPVPEGWRIRPLEECVSQLIDHRGKTPKKLGGDWSEHGTPALSAKNVKAGRIIRSELNNFVSEEMLRRWMPVPLSLNDIVMTSEAPLGELVYLARNANYCLSQRVFGIRANPEVVEPSYLYCFLESDAAQSQLAGRASGTTVIGIRQSELRRIEVPVAPIGLQRAAAKTLQACADLFAQLDESTDKLATLRDYLLPRLLSGRVRVGTTDEPVEDAT